MAVSLAVSEHRVSACLSAQGVARSNAQVAAPDEDWQHERKPGRHHDHAEQPVRHIPR